MINQQENKLIYIRMFFTKTSRLYRSLDNQEVYGFLVYQRGLELHVHFKRHLF